MCKTCTNLTHTNLETVHSIHFELCAFVVKVRDIDNHGQNVWDKVSFSRIAAVFRSLPPSPPMQCWTTRSRKRRPSKNMLDGSHNSPDNCSGLAPVERDVEQRRAFVKFRKHFAGSPTVRWKTAEYCATRWKFDQSARIDEQLVPSEVSLRCSAPYFLHLGSVEVMKVMNMEHRDKCLLVSRSFTPNRWRPRREMFTKLNKSSALFNFPFKWCQARAVIRRIV